MWVRVENSRAKSYTEKILKRGELCTQENPGKEGMNVRKRRKSREEKLKMKKLSYRKSD